MNKKILITIITLISIILLVVVGMYIFKNKDTSTNKNNEVKETLKEENQNNSEINVDKNDEQSDEEIEESNDKDDEEVESNLNDVDNSIKENNSNTENSTSNKDNSNNNNTNQNQNNNVNNSTPDDSTKEQTPWEKLGITEYEYYNTPVWSWQNVDFGVDLEGDKYCANESDCLSKCQKYGDEYLSQNNNGGYNCDDVLSYSGRYLGVDFEFFELQP